ncbi:MAG: hypothetical protein LLF94_00635 [Chlamydiales bacterium]|nr:hypothetical protein [Chlamydiales bacterium]
MANEIFVKLRKNLFHKLPFLTTIMVLGAVGALSACSAFTPAVEPTMSPNTIKDVVVHESYSQDVQTKRWALEEGGSKIKNSTQVGLGFVRLEDSNTSPDQLPQNDELHLNSGEPLKLNLILEAGQSSTFLVTVLVDYKQAAFSLDGQYGLLHEVYVESSGDLNTPIEDLYIPIEIDITGQGAHDVFILAFGNPYDRAWDSEGRDGGSSCQTASRRTVVIVDEVENPFQSIKPDVFGVSPPPEVDFGLYLIFADVPASSVDTSHPSTRQMKMTEHGRAGKEFKYQLWLSNYNLPDDVVDIGYMRFLDYHQINFKGKDLFVTHFDGRQEAIVDDSIVLPIQKGVHELQIIYVFNPYKSILNGEVLGPFVLSSSCMGIDVR